MDIPKWSICKLVESHDDKVEIQFSMVVTFITLNLEITFDDSDKAYLRKFKATHQLNVVAILKIRMTEKVQKYGWCLIIVGGKLR